MSMLVNLYTVRLLWQVLGVDNYGIYNVVGGIVLMFVFLNSAMVSTSQRFISYELGAGNKDRLKLTFSASLTVHILLSILVFVLAETVGLWFLNSKLNLPANSIYSANWVYQCSLLALVATIISVPYNACIVAHEHMKAFGYFGIVEVFLKLGIVLLVAVLPTNRLITYSILVLVVAVIMRLIYARYCKRHFEECRFQRARDRGIVTNMFSFAGWSFLGNMGFAVRDQCLNIILNLWFNVAVNAAKSIAQNLGNAINGFAGNFTMAVNPQITKRYASGDTGGMMRLVCQGCKYSLILMAMIVVPVIVSSNDLLKLWLDVVAPFTVGFLQLSLVVSLIDCVVSPITTALQATGKIKKFQIVISLIMISNIPLAWIWLKFDVNPYVVMFVSMMTSIAGVLTRLLLLKELVKFSLRKFLTSVYLKTIPCIVVSLAVGWYSYGCFTHDIFGVGAFAILNIAVYCTLIFLFALNNNERDFITTRIKNKLRIKHS